MRLAVAAIWVVPKNIYIYVDYVVENMHVITSGKCAANCFGTSLVCAIKSSTLSRR